MTMSGSVETAIERADLDHHQSKPMTKNELLVESQPAAEESQTCRRGKTLVLSMRIVSRIRRLRSIRSLLDPSWLAHTGAI
jgi:hypothetical protein